MYLKFVLLMVHSLQYQTSLASGFVNSTDFHAEKSPIRKYSYDNEFLFMVLIFIVSGQLRVSGEKACTGTLVRSDLVLTLASCLLVQKSRDPEPDKTIVIERLSHHGFHKLEVVQIYINPNYFSEDDSVSKAHDFALIIVKTSNQTEFPKLPQENHEFKDVRNTCILGGYGNKSAISMENFKIFFLNETKLDEYTGRACNAGNLICVHFHNLMPCYNGDFGSPLVCDGILYALNTPRFNQHTLLFSLCQDFYTTVFSPVSHVKEWVVQTIEKPMSTLEWLGKPLHVLILCFVVFTIMVGIYYGLMEIMQRVFDPEEGLQMEQQDDYDYEDSFSSQTSIQIPK